MIGYIDKIKQISKQILKDCQVEMVMGFRRGTVPMMNEPCFAKTEDDVDQFVWDGNCGINLANYLTGRREKIGIVAKGCDTRNIVTHIIENKIDRDQLYIIGVPCKGMIDRRRTNTLCEGIREVTDRGDTVKIVGTDVEKELAKSDLLQKNCATCAHPNPVIYDELVADLVDQPADTERWADVKKIEAMSSEDKWGYFDDLLKECVRCYACRNACPLCYCPTCFVDESTPQWVGKSQDPIDVRTFHFLRAYHCAGRCTDCGACERACPVGINMRVFTRKLEKDCYDQYGWEAGLTLDVRPPLDTYRADDPEAFIK